MEDPLLGVGDDGSLLKSFKWMLCRAVADVGQDINAACPYNKLHGLLQLVSVLGIRQTLNRYGK